jgi:ubiquinol oxidase
LEEEAVHTYTVLLKQIDNGIVPEWAEMPAPKMSRDYYNLPENAKLREVILSVRADESIHREVNHFFTD